MESGNLDLATTGDYARLRHNAIFCEKIDFFRKSYSLFPSRKTARKSPKSD